ncbi:hypothetical protein [Arthrobacter sp. NPDC090010]|uniref:hypothetical protein n=1 Tax=Arthrobacter sp. NPDC090010 TaxID=3363942 RepID=UPI00381498DB
MSKHPKSQALGLLASAVLTVALSACSPAATPSPEPSSTGSSQPDTSPSSFVSASPTSAASALPAGFPRTLLPLMPGAHDASGTVTPRNDFTDIALNATVPAKPEAVDSFYSARFTALGFKAPPAVTVSGVLTKTFVRSNGDETISLSVTPVAGGSTVTIGATVKAGSVK